MERDESLTMEIKQVTMEEAIICARNYIKYETKKIITYPPNFYEKLEPIKLIFPTDDLILYYVDLYLNKINYRQTKSNFKEIIDIKIGPDSHLPGVVAYQKKDYLIENPISFAKKNKNIFLEMNTVKNCILCFPILNSNKDVLLVIELSRSDGGGYTKDCSEYLTEFGKWCGLSIEQLNRRIEATNLNSVSHFLESMLSKLMSNHSSKKYEKFLYNILKFYLDSVQGKMLVQYELKKSKNNVFLGRLSVIASTVFKTLSSTVLISNKEQGFVNLVTKSNDILNVRIDSCNFTKVNELVRAELKEDLKNALYVPVKKKDQLIGVFVAFNSQKGDTFTKADINFGKLISNYISSAINFMDTCSDLEKEEARTENAMEILNYGLFRTLKITDDFPEAAIPSNFSNFTWYPLSDTPFLTIIYIMLNEVCPNYFIEESLKTFIISIKNSTRLHIYHNFITIVLHTHFIYVVLMQSGDIFSTEEKAALMLYSISKYMNHIGLDNETLFLMKHPMCKGLNKMYIEQNALDGTKHHMERSKILNHLPKDKQHKILKYLSSNFLAPASVYEDLFKAKLFRCNPTFDINNPKFGDLKNYLILWGSNNCRFMKKFTLCTEQAENLYFERYAIGDIQKKMKLKKYIAPELDRDNISDIPANEIKLIDEFIIPLCKLLIEFIPGAKDMVGWCQHCQQGYHLIMKKSRKAFLLEESFYARKDILDVPGSLLPIWT